MFQGHVTNTINDKGRLSIPSRFRETLEECGASHFVITKSLDTCLVAYAPENWETVLEKTRKLSSVSLHESFYLRHVVGSAEKCVIDAQGRILIPASLRKYAGLKKECLLVGIGERFEIWDQDTYDTAMHHVLASPENLRAELAKLGL